MYGFFIVPLGSLAAVLIALGTIAAATGRGRIWVAACWIGAAPPALTALLIATGPESLREKVALPLVALSNVVSAPLAAGFTLSVASRLRAQG